MTEPMRVHVADTLDAAACERLAARVGDRVCFGPFDERTAVMVAGMPRPDQLDAPALRALIIPYAGLLPPTRRALLEHRPGLDVYSLHHNAPAAAELALTLALCTLRRVVPLDRALRQGDWRPRFGEPCRSTLAERRALVIGFGHIGSRLATTLLALGLHVRATRRRQDVPAVDGGVELYPAAMLDELMRESDLVFVCAPLTEETRGLLDARRLASLPRNTIVINVSRAELVDEDALYEALVDGTLAGAGLDVWYAFPRDAEARANTAPARRPFWELDNVVLSPHRAGLVDSALTAREADLQVALTQLAHDQVPRGRVDVAAGY